MNPTAYHSTNTPRFPVAFRWSLLAAPLIILFVAHLLTCGRLTAKPQAASQSKPLAANASDDWRRTANGWERNHSWPTAISPAWRLFHINAFASTTSRTQASSRPRLDTHPAVLALAQLFASILVLSLFRSPQQASPSLSALLATISRSFRASAFGS